MKRSWSGILWGLLFICAGIAVAGKALNLWDFESLLFPGWWTLFIIVPCLVGMFKNGFHTGNVMGFLVGVILLLGYYKDDITFLKEVSLWNLLFPAVLISIGIGVLAGGRFQKVKNISATLPGNAAEYSAVFGGQSIKYAAEPLEGLKLNAVFGGMEIDLRDAIITHDIVIETNAVFGGIDVVVPENVKVRLNTFPMFGGASCKFAQTVNADAPTIVFNGAAVFGGVDIVKTPKNNSF